MKIRIKYDELENIARKVDAMHERADERRQSVRTILYLVDSGGWVGRGAKAFRDELTDDILPTLGKLIAALEAISDMLRTAMQRMSDAEHQAAALFSGNIGELVGAALGGIAARVVSELGNIANNNRIDPYSIVPTDDGQLTGVQDAKILFINGINTSGEAHLGGLRDISDMYDGKPVAGIYNKSTPYVGIVGDLFQSLGDWSEAWTGGRLINNPAVDSAMDWIRNNPEGQLVVHSQGAAVTSAALMNLQRQGVDLSQLKVRVLGGAGPVFPSGPDYEFFQTDTDPVPVLTRILNAPLQLIFTERANRMILDHDFNIFNPIEGHGIDVYKDKIKQLMQPTENGGGGFSGRL